jgi:hypothetical protein
VEVPLDPPAGCIRGGHDPRARLHQFRPGIRVRDCHRDEFGKLDDPLLGVRIELSAPRRNVDRAPETTLDHDRGVHEGADALLPKALGQIGRRRTVNAGANRMTGVPDRGEGEAERRLEARSGRAWVRPSAAPKERGVTVRFEPD